MPTRQRQQRTRSKKISNPHWDRSKHYTKGLPVFPYRYLLLGEDFPHGIIYNVEDGMFIPQSIGHDWIHSMTYTDLYGNRLADLPVGWFPDFCRDARTLSPARYNKQFRMIFRWSCWRARWSEWSSTCCSHRASPIDNTSRLPGRLSPVFRIRICCFRVRIQHFRLNTNPDPGVWWPKCTAIKN